MMPRSVLIVDDSSAMRRSVRQLFETSGWEVVGEAENGEQGVQMAEKLEPAVVTLDVAMPVMNGIEAAKQLMTEAPQIQIILCTAYGSDESLKRILRRSGIYNVISKSDATQLLVPTAEKLSVLSEFLGGNL
jgi:two-component system chemotaxis response regulator CheY